MNRFVTIGLDIRNWPIASFPSADATAWFRNEGAYEEAQVNIGCYENAFQLLQVDEPKKILQLADYVRSSADAVLIALEITQTALAGFTNGVTEVSLPDSLSWETLGLDICDANGFFSFLHMRVNFRESMPLLSESNLLEAYTLAEVANVRIPAHRPFVIVRIKKLKD